MVLVGTELGVKYYATVLLLISCTIYTVCFYCAWSGDVDLNDGTLQKTYQDYRQRLQMISSISAANTSHARMVLQTLALQLNDSCMYLKECELISYIFRKAIRYQACILIHIALAKQTLALEKLKEKDTSSNSKHFNELKWDINDIQHLLQECSWVIHQVDELDALCSTKSVENSHLVAAALSTFKSRVEDLVHGITRKQREPASHAMVFMISPENRVKKPYALPVQLLPYRGLKDSQLRELANKLKTEMKHRNMEVVGMNAFHLLSLACMLAPLLFY